MQILTKRSLDDALGILNLSTRVEIEAVRVHWPELTELIRLANAISNSQSVATSIVEDRCLFALGLWFAELADGPVKTLNQTSGYGQLVSYLRDAINIDGPQAQKFQAQLELVQSIGPKPHPATYILEDWISAVPVPEGAHDGPRPGLPATALVSKREVGRQATQEWLISENLFADAVTYTHTKRAPAYENLVIFGPPSRYENSKWSSSPEADYRAQWLLTSPAAPRILILTWPFHSKLDLTLMGPWKGSPPPGVSLREETSQPEVVPTFSFNTRPIARQARFNFDKEPDVVSATEHEILGDEKGLWVFFDANLGPRPRVLARDFGGTYSPAGHRPLHVGDHLVFRSQDVERAHLLEASESWWNERYTDYSFPQAEEQRVELKNRLQEFIDRHGPDQLRTGLVSTGLSKEYVKQIHARVLDPEYVAPRLQESYKAICRVLEYRPRVESFDLLGKLRTARQQAGSLLMRELLLKLQSSAASGLNESLIDEGYANLQDDTLGELFVTTVSQVSEEKRLFPISRLGRPVDTDGAFWLK